LKLGGELTLGGRPVTLDGLANRRFRIVICRGPECGGRRGSESLHGCFQHALDANGANEVAELAWQSCFGRCTQGPNVLVREVVAPEPSALTSGGFATLPGPRGVTALYNRFDATRVEPVIVQHVLGGHILREYIERPGTAGIGIPDPVASRTKELK
jgi:(2Fe-2S) ferredoxin